MNENSSTYKVGIVQGLVQIKLENSRSKGKLMRTLTEEMVDDFFFIHTSLVHGALKKCGVLRSNQNYDDLVQIGLLTLVKVYEQFPEDLCEEEYFYQFTGFAFQKIRWAVIDELRKYQLKKEREETVSEFFDDESESFRDKNEDWIVWQLFPSMLDCLAPNEQIYLNETVLNQLSVTDIARKHKVSRKTVYQWKNRTALKLSHFKAVLTN